MHASFISLTFDLDVSQVVGVLQALLHLAAVEAGVVLPQALQPQGEVGGGVGVVEQRGSVFVGLVDPHPVAAGDQDLRLRALSQNAPFDPGEGENGVAAIGGGRRRRVGQRHQAG